MNNDEKRAHDLLDGLGVRLGKIQKEYAEIQKDLDFIYETLFPMFHETKELGLELDQIDMMREHLENKRSEEERPFWSR